MFRNKNSLAVERQNVFYKVLYRSVSENVIWLWDVLMRKSSLDLSILVQH